MLLTGNKCREGSLCLYITDAKTNYSYYCPAVSIQCAIAVCHSHDAHSVEFRACMHRSDLIYFRG